MVDLNRLLGDLKVQFGDTLKEKKISLEISDFPQMFGNRILLFQVFQNLISNALKFVPSGEGIVRVGVEEAHAHAITFFVQDNGMGIDEKYHQKVFNIFHRLNKNSHAGTGIGLATCKKIIDNLNGQIWIKSAPGKGATFYVTLPVVMQKGMKNAPEFQYTPG